MQTIRRFARSGLIAVALLAAATSAGADTPAAKAAAPSPVPVERFALQRFLSQPQISPDGLWVAARTQVGEINYLIAYPFADPVKGLRRIEVGKKPVEAVNWAGSHQLLVTVRTRMVVFDSFYPATRLLAVDLNTLKITFLDPKSQGLFAGDVLYTDPAGAWALVSSQDDVYSTPSVKRIDLVTGKTSLVERERADVWN